MRIISCASSCFIVSSATPMTIRIEVPPNAKLAPVWLIRIVGSAAIAARKSAPGNVSRARMRSRNSAVGRPGLHARDEAAVLPEVLGLVDGVERDRRVEVGEDDDQDALAEDVVPAAGREEVVQVVPKPVRFWPISCPIVGGIAITLAAKMTGMTPAMLTRSGR